jgi:hypothetical protein
MLDPLMSVVDFSPVVCMCVLMYKTFLFFFLFIFIFIDPLCIKEKAHSNDQIKKVSESGSDI